LHHAPVEIIAADEDAVRRENFRRAQS
jgi:hypothetical protein